MFGIQSGVKINDWNPKISKLD